MNVKDALDSGTPREENLLFIKNKFIELESRLTRQIAKENDIIKRLSQSHDELTKKLEKVYSIINVHNEHYTDMAKQMTELTESNKKMTSFLSTLEKLHQMLDIAESSARKNGR